MKQYFTNKILKWHEEIDRPLPWKGEKDPYLIWLSEIILQQTRVSQGLPYFLKFKERFPEVQSLADANEDELLKLWQGLGYYSRARNLHEAAKYICTELKGKFPNNYNDLKKMKGVGDYTAAAIASFAFNQPHAVVDGNVYRVLSRFFGIPTPIDSTEGKKEFHRLANELIPGKKPGAFNQAMMDFGAIQCVPAQPKCQQCPIKRKCVAFNESTIAQLPVKSKKIIRKHRYFHYLVIRDEDSVFLNKRKGNDIWKNLYEFPLVESEQVLSIDELIETESYKQLFGHQNPEIKVSGSYKQTLTHQKIHALFFEVIGQGWNGEIRQFTKVHNKFLNNFAFPKVIDWYLKDKTLCLSFNQITPKNSLS